MMPSRRSATAVTTASVSASRVSAATRRTTLRTPRLTRGDETPAAVLRRVDTLLPILQVTATPSTRESTIDTDQHVSLAPVWQSPHPPSTGALFATPDDAARGASCALELDAGLFHQAPSTRSPPVAWRFGQHGCRRPHNFRSRGSAASGSAR